MSIRLFTDQTTPARSQTIPVELNDTISIYISGAASVQIIANPFESTSKDIVIETIAASEIYSIPANFKAVVNIVSVTGSVDVLASTNK